MPASRTIQGTGCGLFLFVAVLLTAADNPNDAAKWKALGVSHAARGDYAGAEGPFHRACLLDPKLPDACLYFGRTLYLLDRFDQAVNVLRTALENDPQNPQIYRIEALALEASGKAGEAETVFREAIRLEKHSQPNEDPSIDYGVFLYRQGRAEASLEPLQAALARHPDASRAQLELGCVLLALDRVEQAAAHLERATALDPQGARGHFLLGKAYQRMGKTELARKELDQGSRTVK
ncbi:MAG: tetratricopeptide repeat protein [Candidatus Sulfopaludibacter sp.]|nr:tetratricopeptide repeat protein [Candidatus Sulfopaludibacter sp.]